MSQVVCNASQGVVTRFLRCSTWNLNGLAAVSFQFAICGPDVYFHLRRVFHVEPRIFAFQAFGLDQTKLPAGRLISFHVEHCGVSR